MAGKKRKTGGSPKGMRKTSVRIGGKVAYVKTTRRKKK